MTTDVSFLKLPIIGVPGMDCGHRLLEDGEGTEVVQDFKDEFGPCDETARWMVGYLLVCQRHAAEVARLGGDDIDDIEAAWRARL